MTDREVFINALEREDTPEELAAYLDEACGADSALRARVEALLAADKHGAAGGFLDGAASGLDATLVGDIASIAEGPMEKIGNYRLLEEIGAGGFGVVYAAEQLEPVKRRVAMKIIKLGMDTKQVVARFEAERQALALMDHPNIAKVFDAGSTEAGRPFFVMELVKGVPITEFCDSQKLDTRARLELFGDVCEAINHAHQKGVIHRDIKPSNVLVAIQGDRPVAKVIDFGIAKATQQLTDKTLFTQAGQLIGTPAYMSPEQVTMNGLDIDTRSDIYSLGVLLYELLAGKPPFDPQTLAEAGFEEIRRIIREEEPPRPSTRIGSLTQDEREAVAKGHRAEVDKIGRLVKGDLDWIVMRAIDKERSRRYETANAFRADLVRYLSDEPVSAMPPSTAYRFRKFARRNRGALLAAGGVAAALVAGTAVSVWQAVEADAARGREAEQRGIADVKAEEAQANAEQASRNAMVAFAKFQEAEDVLRFFTETVLAAARPASQEGGLGIDVTVADAIDAAEPHIARAFADRPRVEASIRETIGRTYDYLGEPKKVVPQAERVVELVRSEHGNRSMDTLAVMDFLASAYDAVGRRDDAIEIWEQTLAAQTELLGPDHRHTLNVMHNLASAYDKVGKRKEALKHAQKAFELKTDAFGEEDPDTLRTMMSLASYYRDAGRKDDALELEQRALGSMEQIHGKNHPETLSMKHNIGVQIAAERRFDEALELFEGLLKTRKKVQGDKHPDTLRAMFSLAGVYSSLGRAGEALELYEVAWKTAAETLDAEHPLTLTFRINLASAYSAVGREPEALEMTKETYRLQKKHLGTKHPETLLTMINLAGALNGAGQKKEALYLLEKALEPAEQVFGEQHPQTLVLMNNLALSYSEAGRFEAGIEMAKTSYERQDEVIGPEHPHTLAALENLALAYERAGRSREALPYSEKALAAREKLQGSEHTDTLRVVRNLADTSGRIGRWDEARQFFATFVAAEGERMPSTYRTWYGVLLAESRDAEAHRDHCERFLKKYAASDRPEHWERVSKTILIFPADRDVNATLLEEAVDLARRCSEREPDNPYYSFCRGLAEHRDGDPAEAMIWLARAGVAEAPSTVRPAALAFHSIAAHRSGDPDLARAKFDSAETLLKPLMEMGDGDLGESWSDKLICELAVGEARLAISGNGQ